MTRSSDSGVTLVEVLISMAVASFALAGAAGLLATSARAVAEAELETTAIWAASRTIEEWRSQAVVNTSGSLALDRGGNPATGPGLFEVVWTAQPEPGGAGVWRITATVNSRRLQQPVTVEAVVARGAS